MSLPLPETPERAIRAGSISDVRHVCDGGLSARRMGVKPSCLWEPPDMPWVTTAQLSQTFLPVGATAVNPQ